MMMDKGVENESSEAPILDTKQMLENDVRSNLRYCWQRAMTFAVFYKPTIQEVKDELLQGFMSYIPKGHPAREQFQNALSSTFFEMLGELFSTKDLRNEQLENKFIDKAIRKIRKLL